MNWWWLRVPLNVLDVANHDSRNPVLLTSSTELTKNKVTPSTLASAKSNNCFGVRIWFEKGRRRLACAASLLMVPPTLLQAFFPCDVAKEFHSAWMWKSFWWNTRSVKFLKLLYCAAITEIEHFVQIWKFFTDVVFMKVFQKTVHRNCVMGLVVTYVCIRFMGKLTTSINIMYHERVYCCLWIVPMKSLGSILD